MQRQTLGHKMSLGGDDNGLKRSRHREFVDEVIPEADK
jgi:hypothetical protein